MNRRALFRLITALPAVVLLPRADRRPEDSLLLQESPMAGFQHYAGPNLWADIRIGDELLLLREPGNPHDRRAVAVFWDGFKIGYLPRIENTAVAQLMDRGIPLEARITRVRKSEDPWERVRLSVAVS